MTLRTVAAHRPVENKDGPTTVWHQQRTYFLEHQEHRCPRVVFVMDLVAEIEEWLAAGDHIVIGMDANQSLTSRTCLEKELAKVGIHNALSH